MRFSARQQYCLETMGIVPWVSKAELSTIETQSPDAASDIQVPTPQAPMPVERHAPTDIVDLPSWLVLQPLMSFLSGGKQRYVSGADDDALLVVVQSGISGRQQPLEGDAARLFDLMMRAINVSRQQLRLCALASDDAGASAMTVPKVCTPQTKAILLLLQDWDVSDEGASSQDDGITMVAPALPLWRVAHPDVLLRHNSLKRQAWHSLQALSRVL